MNEMRDGGDGHNRYRIEKFAGEVPTGSDWSRAESLRDFAFPWEDTPPPATEFRAVWNEERLFFRFDCEDADLVLGEGAGAKERVIGSDRVEIFLARDRGLDRYYAFEMDPRGEVLAYAGRYYREFDWDWACAGFEVKGAATEPGYRVEGSFSLDTLRRLDVLKPGGADMIAGVYRAEFSHRPDGSIHESWMPWIDPGTAKPDFHVPDSFGVFELIPRTS